MVEKINPNQVYISYQGDNQAVVDRLCSLLHGKGIAYCTFQEERGQIGHIHDFEKKIGRARIKVIFYSQKYFESPHCMNEYAEIREHEDCDQYVRMVNCGNVKFTRDFVISLEKAWSDKEIDLKYKIGELKREENAAREHHFYKAESDKYCVQKLETYFRGDPNYDNCSDSDLEGLVSDIKKYIDKHSALTSYDELPKLRFATRRIEQIVPRVTEAEKIKKLFEKESIVNMVGWGGCGKSTISEYFVNKYRNCFSQITGITINNDFYEDICKVYTELLNVPYKYDELSKLRVGRQNELRVIVPQKRDYVSTYSMILFKLEKYPKLDGKFNLIIIDVNETVGTSGYERIKKAIEDIDKKCLSNWKILVISRVPLVSKPNRTYELYDVCNVEFDVLRQIFFKYLKIEKTQYYEEGEFGKGNLEKLFLDLYNNPLLVEQLAYYLSNQDKTSYKDIVHRLDIEDGIKAEGRMGEKKAPEETAHKIRNQRIRKFLSKLITFEDLDAVDDTGDIQRKIVRLFVVWERVYYSADEVIYFLVDGYNEDDIRDCLSKLVEKLVFDHREEDGKTKYQIHGLMAESFREQIFVDAENRNSRFRDFSDYIKKIDSFDGKDKVIKEKCIIHSLANYVSFDEKYLLKKARDYTEISIYERALKIKYLKIKTDYQISEKEIYSMFDKTEFKNSYADELYFKWLYKESGYSSVLDCHKPLKNKPNVAKMIQDMVRIDDGTQRNVFVRIQKKGVINWIKSLFHFNIDELVRRDVRGFCICKYQVTQDLWYEVMDDNPSYFKKGGNYPVENVSWCDCLAFIMELNQITGMTFGFPTEKQWEFAASCNGKYEYAGTNDENKLEKYAWYGENSGGETHEVGTRDANDFGLYDMSGNVREWCQEWYLLVFSRVLRGGSWRYFAYNCRVSSRDCDSPDHRDSYYGLRLALPCSPSPC